jgi:hypothetical protein
MRNYETVWYCLRRAGGEVFPDGVVAPAKTRNARKPIWINLGGGTWRNAISFGSNRYELERAALDFGAKDIVWLEPEPESTTTQKQYNRWIHGGQYGVDLHKMSFWKNAKSK